MHASSTGQPSLETQPADWTLVLVSRPRRASILYSMRIRASTTVYNQVGNVVTLSPSPSPSQLSDPSTVLASSSLARRLLVWDDDLSGVNGLDDVVWALAVDGASDRVGGTEDLLDTSSE
jgi:hypothetical protein